MVECSGVVMWSAGMLKGNLEWVEVVVGNRRKGGVQWSDCVSVEMFEGPLE